MDIGSKKAYSNYTYTATVVNANTDQDPEGKNRVQIYIPALQIEYSNIYADYMKKSKEDKKTSEDRTKFPWATTLVSDLKDGNNVIGCNLNNKSDEYVIIGLDVNNAMDNRMTGSGSGLDGYSGDASGLLDLAMPIILLNEVGLSINSWPDNISNSKYGLITPYDKGCKCSNKSSCPHSGGWSIGLIQWHHGRAFNLMFEIAKADSNWKSKSPNSNLGIVKDLESSIKSNSTYGYASKYTDNYHPISGTDPYKFIYNMLTSDIGKKVQRNQASADTSDAIKKVTGSPYNVSNPAIIIWLVDLMNRYGPNLNDTIKEAGRISATSGDMMKQLDSFVSWVKKNYATYNDYKSRRDRTYSYISGLYTQGKLTNILSPGSPSSYTTQGFTPRTTAPKSTDYWYSSARPNTGYNMWTNGGNCAYYAWARASEILGKNYDGASGNGVNYLDKDKYQRGTTPKQGAIIAWSGGSSGAGHVAIVENVSADGQTIWTSESGWRSFIFKYKKRTNDGNWGATKGRYTCRGFKYLI